ncbi:cytosolic 5'-nucleotidase 1A-like [Hippocampus zosterae]|uniref:cytosolic 5'-nucleotidase 1A-like n=1 Tax=Hippocampus zosterae TaxID=109293 RepID=UPI00223D1ED9|nr:cytosolic 5'-nucleotidase 1A-like [Hippocampus zosterae]
MLLSSTNQEEEDDEVASKGGSELFAVRRATFLTIFLFSSVTAVTFRVFFTRLRRQRVDREAEMVSTVANVDVKQKDADHALVVAISCSAVLEDADDGDVHRVGVAFPLLQALQSVNRHLVEANSSESLLFDVLLITTDERRQRQSARIVSSTKHYGLEVSRFCFSDGEDFVESLLENQVQLFLSTEPEEVALVWQRGVPSSLLGHQTWSSPSEQLRVLLCGDDVIAAAAAESAQRFWSQLGAMRRRFGVLGSPVSVAVMTAHGGRRGFADALATLRSCGLNADEAHCLAGAPRGPILELLRPHVLLGGGLR